MFRSKHQKKHNLYISNRKKVTRIDKNGEEITKNISNTLQFIDSARFLASSISNLVNNLFEGIHNSGASKGWNSTKKKDAFLSKTTCSIKRSTE